MVGCDEVTQQPFVVGGPASRLIGHQEYVDVVTEVITATHGVVGDKYGFVHLGTDIYFGCLSDDSDHLIIYVVNL